MKKTPCATTLFVLAISACNKAATQQDVPVKQDTPQAVAATVIKLYEKKNNTKWPEVVDPALGRMEARVLGCSSESLLETQCLNELMASGGQRQSERCKARPPFATCLCGSKGSSAAAKNYIETSYHEGLGSLGLHTNGCNITDADEKVSFDEAKKLLGDTRAQCFCDEVKASDTFGTVTFVCGADIYQLVLRKNQSAWKVLGFELDTSIRLQSLSLAAGAKKGADQRQKDLNKDMK